MFVDVRRASGQTTNRSAAAPVKERRRRIRHTGGYLMITPTPEELERLRTMLAEPAYVDDDDEIPEIELECGR